ncbi:pentatricopeptide repeat-containing protein At1g08070, chloroplastic-like [Amborella trichopoda]|uniref:pentatricopeptide repeat-containing protein At1g08070, chloroplastic-like n=1 Tax=Amborella trichopoda TaxID=13333 RepID=UPI0005D3B4DF|nr:pentatricopeptide repeat-containing protein At1g08070, chloroplastic-like [Amborella trichopoda]|eukprot:XP_011627083.1 pentatricopeptide repeat-containing protein At1g08070, chloroplastic-like [Amborella trichopoda]
MVLYLQMVSGGILPDQFTLSFIVKACIGLRALHLGKLVHAHILVFGYDYDLYLATSLVEMYAKCHKIECAHLVFNKVSHGDIFLWTVLISGYLHIGDHECALNLLYGFLLFRRMLLHGVEPDKVTMCMLLPACSHSAILQLGMEVHAYILRRSFELDLYVVSSLIDIYAKCGCLPSASFFGMPLLLVMESMATVKKL